MRILNKLFTKNKLKNNIECVFKHLIACSAIKSLFFSQEILGEERIPPGSHEENNALIPISIWNAVRILYNTVFKILLYEQSR